MGALPASINPDGELLVPLDEPIDLARTLAPIAHGTGDPTIRFEPSGIWRATRMPDGAATLRIAEADGGVRVSAWGPGSQSALAGAADLIGVNDDPKRLKPHDPIIAELARRYRGLRLPRTNRPFEALLPAICEQKVTGVEARAAFRGIVRAHGEPAPGPAGLRLAPTPSALAGLPYFAFHRFGLERRRSEVIIAAARLAPRLEGRDEGEVLRRLGAMPGIGPWTLAEVARVAFGDSDAVSIGDYHLPNLVAWNLAHEPRADNARMLQLLEPYMGQRGRVQRLLEAGGLQAPRYGPHMAPRRIAEM